MGISERCVSEMPVVALGRLASIWGARCNGVKGMLGFECNSDELHAYGVNVKGVLEKWKLIAFY